MSFIKRYKYTIGFLISIGIAIILFMTGTFHILVGHLDGFGYVGALIAGFFFSFTFTAASAGLFFVEIGDTLNPFLLAILAGVGAMCADMIMFKFMKVGILAEIKTLLKAIISIPTLSHMERLTKKKVWLWGIPFFASLLIASPLPNEIGIALFGVINFRPKYLSAISYLLNTIGICALIFLGRAIG
ncbi:MAG: hypothetical protein COV60_02250 [Candidatus Magasanikbacteria bacterium CG11_big_fil_rev_8_21_14_0_20_43_7]|uniref:TVP38/TMEM64 family membrane protein n=1 Tax=Candidatus Magasanikbacteria bacterium CG11_big_fil_rev_8_21_14_0_20_43_7 TaxID=1974654 RepID=A0A2H0N4N1_9BACT|nr:MAG: hypothetical protein COV60_02250 [Candidatus Magasanikbacteria bacterium CG11_big_fil_rev_8_21_14_0_20_43_7]